MAHTGTAQAAASGEMTFCVTVRNKAATATTTFSEEVDLKHCGAQIKVDVLGKELGPESPPMPPEMRSAAKFCNLFLCAEGCTPVPVDDFMKLSECGADFKKGMHATLLILESGDMPVQESAPLTPEELGLNNV